MPRPKKKKLNQKQSAESKKGITQRSSQVSCPIVGIGASAGGLAAFKIFFSHMRDDSGLAFVLVPHLDPTHQSLMVELLTRHTEMPVCEVTHDLAVEPDHVYIIPPAKYLEIRHARLYLSKPPQTRGIETAIDNFLRSLAEDQQERAIGIILSGTSSYGTLGLQAIKANGGMAMVQRPDTAEYDAMPQNAIDSGIVDYILPPEEMPTALIKYIQHAYVSGEWAPSEPATTERDISERLQLDALRMQTERLVRMVEHLPAGAVYIDKGQLMMNRAAEKITGYDRDELTTLDQWFTKLYGERDSEVRQQYQQDREAGFPKQTEPITLTRKNGEQRFVEFAGYKFDDYDVWIMHDVTQREEYESALREREERLQAVMSNAAEAIVVISLDGIISDFNNAAQALFGYTADEAIGHNVSQLMPSPYREEHDTYLDRYRETGEARILNQTRELPGCRKDGSIFPMLVTITQIDHIGAFVGIMRDLSDQKALERQIADISTQEQERIGQEIHDGLGQHLTGLNLIAASLKNKLANNNPAEVGQLDELIEQLQQAIKDTRALSRGLSPVPITPEGLTDALTLLARDVKAKTGIDCSFEVHNTIDITDRTSAMQIYRIAQEAVNNAVKYADASKISITLNGGEDPCELTISDNGCGFLLDDAINEGLGIRIMHYRAGVIGCQLSIESAPGEGATVRCIHQHSRTTH